MTSYLSAYTDITASLDYAPQRYADRLGRIQAELRFAHQLCIAYPERAGEWRVRILEAGRDLQAGLDRPAVDLEALTAHAEAILAPIGEVAKTYTLRCVSHAHIDMNWMWSWPETVAVTNDTFRTMLALLDEFPGFIYSQSQASTYELIERYHPAMFEAIRARVQEGRWEVTASQWVEGDKNMAAGESLVRHLLYTRSYFQGKFGLSPEDVQVDFEPDTFGHPATLPAILARGGVRYYYHCRGSRGPHLYWWIGPDGSRVLAFNDVQWYMPLTGPNLSVTPAVADPLVEFSLATGLKQMPVLYGVGDHGGGPTRGDLRHIVEMGTWPIFPALAFSTLHGFFRDAEAAAEAGSANVPEIRGERNTIFPGCYTSQARQKKANRHGENLLYAAETAAALGRRVAGVPYPHANLRAAWLHLLFDQFHDILPGSGTRDTRHYALGRAQESQAAAGMARSNALRALGERVDTASLRAGFQQEGARAYKDEIESARAMGAGVGRGAVTGGESTVGGPGASDRAFLVYNPLPHPRQEVIEVQLWDTALDPTQLVASGGGLDPRPVQPLDEGKYWGHAYRTIAFPVRVPALGYTTVCISDRASDLLPPRVADTRQGGRLGGGLGLADPWAGAGGSARRHEPQDVTLENDLLKITLDPASGGIASLRDKRTGREWVPEGALAGTLQYCVEANEGMTAWQIGQFLTQEDLHDGGRLRVLHEGPYLKTYRWTRSLGASQLTLDVTLRQGAPQVDYRLAVDWREMGSQEGTPHLRVRFPLALDDPQPRYEIPFGAIERDPKAGEVPALRWADLSEAGGTGVTLVNDSKYGFRVEDTTLNMTLLRASIDPDPLPDLGEHTIAYALMPHGAGPAAGHVIQAAEEMNEPLTVLSCGFQEGDLPAEASFVAVAPSNVRLAALKGSEEGEALVLRLVEVGGVDTDARVTLSPLLGVGEATTLDLLERPVEGGEVRLEGEALLVQVPAHGIVTVRLA
jgi:alpha-mannosidase